MSWNGYLSYDGHEIINVPRLHGYARSANLSLNLRTLENDVLHLMLDDDEYRYVDQAGNEAPWYDPNNEDSLDFLGIMPQSITGIDSSTRSSETIEFTTDGGTSGRMRYTTKTVVMNLALIATSEAGADYGRRYLASITSGRDCNGRTPENYGAELHYAASEPIWDRFSPVSAPTCWDMLRRRLLKFRFNQGPTVTARRKTSDGGSMWMVSLSGVAGDAYEYGVTSMIVDSLGDGGNPYVPWVTPGAYENAGHAFVEPSCPQPVYTPLYDPISPALVAPPGPPDLPVLSVPLPTTWTRRTVEIPAELIDRWDDFQLSFSTFVNGAARNIRYRIYETDGFSDTACDYDAAWLKTYIPANATFHADGVYKSAYVDQGGGIRRPANSLIFGRWTRPVEWLGISCGKSYTVTLDTPQDAPGLIGAISLTGRTR